MSAVIEPTNADLAMIELEEEIDRLTDDLRGVHREYQADRYIRLTEKRDAKIKQLEHMRAQQ